MPWHKRISGIYPHLAVTHNDKDLPHSGECGIGALYEYNDKLYFVTYPANNPRGGAGRVYSVDKNLTLTEIPESTGGTHANRLLHRHTGKLIIGANVISPDGSVKSFDTDKLVGRLTSASEHLTKPDEWIYLYTMEDGIYEANVETLEVRCLRRDIIERFKPDSDIPKPYTKKLPGDHMKGGYTAQGVMIVANNGHGGVLAEWNGEGDIQDKESFRVIHREKYTEVIGPDGPNGSCCADKPVWALGWDHRSVLLNVRENSKWTLFRLPKGSYTQDADHGWFTEWPRIRDIGPYHLMCMHGLLYSFPRDFSRDNINGIKPLARHLKMIADFTQWDEKIVFACDDGSMFDNPLQGRPQSNLWFADIDTLENLSMPAGWGGVYLHDAVQEGIPSDPFFVGGFDERILHISTGDLRQKEFVLQAACNNLNSWADVTTVTVAGKGYTQFALPTDLKGDWVRLVSNEDITDCCAYFSLRRKEDVKADESLLHGLHKVGSPLTYSSGKVLPLSGADLKLRFASDKGDYILDGELQLKPAEKVYEEPKCTKAPFEPLIRTTGHSVLLIDTEGNKYHLPRLHAKFDALNDRLMREVVTERSLMNIHGTIYELPRPESGGVRRIKPVCTHGRRITDFATWRGFIVLSGVDKDADGEHIVRSEDGKAALWLGNVDDLWRMGRPQGIGGPLSNTALFAGEASAPYLLAGFRCREAVLSHNSDWDVNFTLDVDFAADGSFHKWQTVKVAPEEEYKLQFPSDFSCHWIRIRVDKDCKATAIFDCM